MGERRWDVVLDHGQRIMLPQDRPVQALEHALALDRAEDLLARDVRAVDFRIADRPVLRLGLDAQNTLRRARGEAQIGPDGQIIEPEADAKAAPARTGKPATKKG